MLSTALHYKSLGLSVLGCRDKRPVMGSWLAYKSAIASDQDITTMFTERKADQLACICGAVSGNLEVIDIDLKNDITGTLWDDLWAALMDYFKQQPPFVVTATPSGGYHLVYRCETPVEGNQKLASRPDGKKKLCLIETRGEGGYFITDPSPGYKNLAEGASIENIPVLSEAARNDILDICRTFNKVFSETQDKPKSKILYSFKQTPWDSYNADPDDPALELLQSHGWTVDHTEEAQVFLRRPGSEHRWGAVYHTDTHHLYVFSSSSEFEPEKGYSPTAILAILEHDGDFSAASAALRKEGYGSLFTETEKKAMDKGATLLNSGFIYSDIMKMLSAEFVSIDEPTMTTIVEIAEKKTQVRNGLFWSRSSKGAIRIEKPKLADFLSDRGYRLFSDKSSDKKKETVHINSETRIIKIAPLDIIKKDLRDWVHETDFSEFEVTNYEIDICLFGLTDQAWKSIFDWLETITMSRCPVLRDTKTCAYVPFKNGVVKIDKSNVTLIEYSALPKNSLVWEDSINPREIDIQAVAEIRDLNNSSAFLFIRRLAGLGPEHDQLTPQELQANYPKEWKSLGAFMTTTGYILSTYKNPEEPYVVVIAEDTADQGQGGGTGKGLYAQIIGHARNMTTIFGRDWDPDYHFNYSGVEPSTSVLLIDDTPKDFKFDRVYNVASEGMHVNQKHKPSYYISYDMSAKLLLTTNYDVPAEGEHGRRRQVKLMVHKYFTQAHKPKDEFGKLLFSSEWNDLDWNWYFTSVFYMISTYIDIGIHRMEVSHNMKEKQVRLRYTDEFYEYISGLVDQGKKVMCDNNEELTITKEYVRFDDLHSGFLDYCNFKSDKDYTVRRFKKGLQFYVEQFGLHCHEQRNWRGSRRAKLELLISKNGVAPKEEVTPF